MRQKIVVRTNPDFGRDAARATLRLASGEILTALVEHCRGSQSRPMTDDEIEDKFRVQCADSLAQPDIDAIPPMVWSWETIADSGAIASHARGKTR